MNKKVYFDALLPNIPRILSQINPNLSSQTFGCCERYYWHNNVTAIANARFQEAVLTLALVYQHGPTEYKDNPYLLRLINGTIGFWLKIQESDGSFNEWYEHEGSYVATAFSTYAVSEAVLLLGKEKIENVEAVLSALVKASFWLGCRSQKSVYNQQSGALIAIYNTYLLTKNDELKKIVQNHEQLISSCQTSEGWFLEYGGPDIGYLSLTVDYLAKYYQKSGSALIEQVLTKALEFLAQFIHSDGTSGGAYASRETEFLIAHGVELLAAKNKNAAFIAAVIRRNLAEDRGVTPFSLDDRYLIYNGYTFLQAGLDGCEELPATQLNRPSFLHYPLAGIVIWRRDTLELIANLKKLGTFVAIVDGKKINDSGVLVEAKQNLYSGYLQSDVHILQIDEGGFSVEGKLCFLKENKMTPGKQILLYIVQFFLGRFEKLRAYIKETLRKKLITQHKTSDIVLKRTICFKENAVSICDELKGLKTFKRMIVGARLSFIYVPSSRLFQRENLSEQAPEVFTAEQLERDKFAVRREFSIHG